MEQKDVKGSYSVSFIEGLWCSLFVESLECLTVVRVAGRTIGLPQAKRAVLSHSLTLVSQI